MILSYERVNSITSKAIGFVLKGRVLHTPSLFPRNIYISYNERRRTCVSIKKIINKAKQKVSNLTFEEAAVGLLVAGATIATVIFVKDTVAEQKEKEEIKTLLKAGGDDSFEYKWIHSSQSDRSWTIDVPVKNGADMEEIKRTIVNDINNGDIVIEDL